MVHRVYFVYFGGCYSIYLFLFPEMAGYSDNVTTNGLMTVLFVMKCFLYFMYFSSDSLGSF
jgi:hypothetical protein